jgi:hypothetical protein
MSKTPANKFLAKIDDLYRVFATTILNGDTNDILKLSESLKPHLHDEDLHIRHALERGFRIVACDLILWYCQRASWTDAKPDLPDNKWVAALNVLCDLKEIHSPENLKYMRALNALINDETHEIMSKLMETQDHKLFPTEAIYTVDDETAKRLKLICVEQWKPAQINI